MEVVREEAEGRLVDVTCKVSVSIFVRTGIRYRSAEELHVCRGRHDELTRFDRLLRLPT